MIDMCDLHVAFLQWTVLFCVTLSWKHLICKMRFILNPIKYVCVCVCSDILKVIMNQSPAAPILHLARRGRCFPGGRGQRPAGPTSSLNTKLCYWHVWMDRNLLLWLTLLAFSTLICSSFTVSLFFSRKPSHWYSTCPPNRVCCNSRFHFILSQVFHCIFTSNLAFLMTFISTYWNKRKHIVCVPYTAQVEKLSRQDNLWNGKAGISSWPIYLYSYSEKLKTGMKSNSAAPLWPH